MKTEFEDNWNYEELLNTLKNGSSQKFKEFVIGRLNNERVEVIGYLHYNTITEVQKEKIRDELGKVKENFIQLMNKSQTFKDFVIGAGIDYSLNMDYGGGSILICAEIEGVYREFI